MMNLEYRSGWFMAWSENQSFARCLLVDSWYDHRWCVTSMVYASNLHRHTQRAVNSAVTRGFSYVRTSTDEAGSGLSALVPRGSPCIVICSPGQYCSVAPSPWPSCPTCSSGFTSPLDGGLRKRPICHSSKRDLCSTGVRRCWC